MVNIHWFRLEEVRVGWGDRVDQTEWSGMVVFRENRVSRRRCKLVRGVSFAVLLVGSIGPYTLGSVKKIVLITQERPPNYFN